MNEIILLKLGELVLKGQNRKQFEDRLIHDIFRRLKALGTFHVSSRQSTVYVEPATADCDMEAAYQRMLTVFGVVAVSRALACEKSLEAITAAALEYLGPLLMQNKTFKVESKRADKTFPMTSIELSQEVGGALHDAFPHLAADMRNPSVTVHVEVRETAAYVHAGGVPGAGGLPVGASGKAVTLLSGGIDSPVSSFLMAKRGLALVPVHFFSYPYTSPQAREKVIALARILVRYTGRMTVFLVPFTKIQEEIRRNCPEELFTLIMRRYMMRIAQRIAVDCGGQAIITGESLGQVASQTMGAMTVTEAVCSLPVLRPVVGLDKEEVVTIARRIGTFETSILPYEDCCTVFTPRHPKTRPNLQELIEAEEKLDGAALMEAALENMEKVVVTL